MKSRMWFCTLLVIVTIASLPGSSFAQTFIRATLPNPSHEPATGYRFQILTPGDVLEAVAQTDKSQQVAGDAHLLGVSLPSNSKLSATAIHENSSTVTFPFQRPIATNDRIDLRVSFTPKEYWKVYFKDVFQYADGHTERSKIPYAAFFISYEPVKGTDKLKASLTIVNNVATSYGIPKSVVNDEQRRPITFHNASVYINNKMDHYDIQRFDRPDGQKVELPSSFTLKAGEAQTFDLGLVNPKSYVLTLSEISYEGETDRYPIACSHPTEPGQTSAAATKYQIFAPANQ
jgi:hypothetical protein